MIMVDKIYILGNETPARNTDSKTSFIDRCKNQVFVLNQKPFIVLNKTVEDKKR